MSLRVTGIEIMPTKNVDAFEVEFTGEQLSGTEQWGAYVCISMTSDNPMHLNTIFPKLRVSVDIELSAQIAAEAEAERVALIMLTDLRAKK
jgi:hypothetical protein